MTITQLATTAILLISLPFPSPAQDDPKPVPARPADVESIDAILDALYEVISGPAGQERDWDRFRSLFVADARLMPIGVINDAQSKTVIVYTLTVEQFVTTATRGIKEAGFFEREIARKTEQFGHIAHVWSTYESRRAADDPKPFDRGINSIQLMHDGTRWHVVSIYWDRESPDQPIPDAYLPSEK